MRRQAEGGRDRALELVDVPTNWGRTIGVVVLGLCLAIPAAGSWLSLAGDWFTGADGPAEPLLGAMAIVWAALPFCVAASIWMLRRRRDTSTSATIRASGLATFALALVSVVASAIVSIQT